MKIDNPETSNTPPTPSSPTREPHSPEGVASLSSASSDNASGECITLLSVSICSKGRGAHCLMRIRRRIAHTTIAIGRPNKLHHRWTLWRMLPSAGARRHRLHKIASVIVSSRTSPPFQSAMLAASHTAGRIFPCLFIPRSRRLRFTDRNSYFR